MLAAEVDSKFQPTTRSSKLKRKVKVIFFYRRGSSAAEKKEKKKKKPSNAVGDIQIFFQMLFCFVLFCFFLRTRRDKLFAGEKTKCAALRSRRNSKVSSSLYLSIYLFGGQGYFICRIEREREMGIRVYSQTIYTLTVSRNS